MSSPFYINNKMSASLEHFIQFCDSYDEFEKHYSDEFLNEDCQIGNYLQQLLFKYKLADSYVSNAAGLHHSYVGNIVRGKRTGPSRDTLIKICIVMHTTVEELQYLLKYAGHSPLYVRRKRDVIIWFGMMKQEEIETIDMNLRNRGLKPLLND